MSILDGKIAFITGSGQGIGRAYGLAFAQEGANVVVADLDGANAESVAGEIAAAGGSAISVQADVGDPASVEGMAAAAREAFGGTDVLLNNAAIFTTLGRRGFEDIPLEEWDRVMRVNVTGGMLCAAAVLPDMRAKKQGRIINISSSTVPMGLPPVHALCDVQERGDRHDSRDGPGVRAGRHHGQRHHARPDRDRSGEYRPD